MDETLQDLENELKRLPPLRPSARLRQGLEQELGGEVTADSARHYRTATNLSSWKWLGWRTTGVAAALALVAALTLVNSKWPATPEKSAAKQPVPLAATGLVVQPRPGSTNQAEHYQPVTASNVLYDLKDEGPAYVDGDTPARRLRYRYLDTYTWKNSRGNASLKWSVPRDEIRVLPVSMN